SRHRRIRIADEPFPRAPHGARGDEDSARIAWRVGRYRLGIVRAARDRRTPRYARPRVVGRHAAEARRRAGISVRPARARARRTERGARSRGERGAQGQDPERAQRRQNGARHVARDERIGRARRRHRVPARGPRGIRRLRAEAARVHRTAAPRARHCVDDEQGGRMRVAAKIAAFQLLDVLRSRWLFGYAIFFLLATELLLRFGGDPTRALVSLTIYVHRAREFIELLLAQPVGRDAMFAGTYAAMAVSLSAGIVLGIGMPFALRGGAGVGLALRTDDRLRAFGIALGGWACAALAYDAALLVAATALAGAPLERPLLVATLANPIDLARVVMLMHLDISALMGYTGASFTRVFTASTGTALAAASLAAWAAGPALLGARLFRRKDF